MKNIFLISFLLFAAHSNAGDFSQTVGNYKVASCQAATMNAQLDYCQYDQVVIEPVGNRDDMVSFEFFKNGKEELSFKLQVQVASDEILVNLDDSTGIKLTSSDSGYTSSISIEASTLGKVMTLSSLSKNSAYSFVLVLQPQK